MSPRAVRRLTTAATLLVLVGVLGFMAVYGFRAVTAPFPGSAAETEECTPTETEVKEFVTRKEVQVSVFNAGTRSGLAGSTLEKVEAAGFRAGNSGNAPEGSAVRKAVVWTTEPDDPAAALVARAFGKNIEVVVTEQDLGPGVDVLVGNRFRELDRTAPKRVRLPAPVETCVQVD